MKTILLDTNFIVSALKNKINLDLELDRVMKEKYQKKIIDKTIDELKKLNTEHSKLSIKILEKQKVKKIRSETNNVDNEIVKNSNKDTIVATLDRKLKKKLKKKEVKTITIRQKKYFSLNN